MKYLLLPVLGAIGLQLGMPSRAGWVHGATTTRKYNGKVCRTQLLRHTYRAGKQVKHENLGNISDVPEALIDLIRRSLAELGTCCRNTCRTNTGGSGASFHLPSELTPLQAKAFRLLAV